MYLNRVETTLVYINLNLQSELRTNKTVHDIPSCHRPQLHQHTTKRHPPPTPTMDTLPTTNATKGAPESTKNKTLETGASLVQNFAPPKRLCAHLNAFHAYANDLTRSVEANHYCAHVNEDVRQCLLYDSPEANARLIGVEYMIKPHLYEKLDTEERKLWHSHVYEVKSGMLIMPVPEAVPDSVWEVAENKEMEEVVVLYGKVFHLWQTDRGDELPLGMPQLMVSVSRWVSTWGGL